MERRLKIPSQLSAVNILLASPILENTLKPLKDHQKKKTSAVGTHQLINRLINYRQNHMDLWVSRFRCDDKGLTLVGVRRRTEPWLRAGVRQIGPLESLDGGSGRFCVSTPRRKRQVTNFGFSMIISDETLCGMQEHTVKRWAWSETRTDK